MANKAMNVMLLNRKMVYIGEFLPRNEPQNKLHERPSLSSNLFAKNLGQNITSEKFNHLFSKFGVISSSVLARHSDDTIKRLWFRSFRRSQVCRKAALVRNIDSIL
ncbi:unnamed protein product [Ceutorhynchus assimilis]|uniref:RRM domain-containing protein n=1 Tax=Ceutorhynchus assimilis TaxID=467358 RepID=A0A9N9QLS1_9CUCU|nr:unnamed protein product [Ceutorhynchus assimilis]